jgi:SWI/SNF-related matrix-associated actin-dependent regulator 1 of chromatin subfamily A
MVTKIPKSKTVLLPYQEEGVRMLGPDGFDGCALLADDMGLGKTVQIAKFMERYLETWPALVVCPASIKYQWQDELRLHAGIDSEVLEGTTVPEHYRFVRKPAYVINYDILHHWVFKLRRLRAGLVVLDECQRIKNPNTVGFRACKELCDPAPNVIAATGTPVENKPMDVWAALHLTRPDVFPNYYRFGVRFSNRVMKFGKWHYEGAKNEARLNRILKRTCMIRRRKEDVLDQLPPKIRTVVPVKLFRMGSYRKKVLEYRQWFNAIGGRILARKHRAQQMARQGELIILAAELKRPSVVDWIEDFLTDNPGRKLIVFGIHKARVLIPLYQKFVGQAVLVTGDVPSLKRKLLFDQFNTDPRTRLLFGNMLAAGAGWSAKPTANCSDVLMAEMWWVPAKHTQAEDRIRGLKRGIAGVAAHIHYMVAKDTIEEKLCQVNQGKQKIADAIVDGIPDDSSFNVYDLLQESLLED